VFSRGLWEGGAVGVEGVEGGGRVGQSGLPGRTDEVEKEAEGTRVRR
jgi:hypothetical protein